MSKEELLEFLEFIEDYYYFDGIDTYVYKETQLVHSKEKVVNKFLESIKKS